MLLTISGRIFLSSNYDSSNENCCGTDGIFALFHGVDILNTPSREYHTVETSQIDIDDDGTLFFVQGECLQINYSISRMISCKILLLYQL